MDISIVVPAYEEEDNVVELYNTIKKVMDSTKKKYEIIFIDDGSKDRTFNRLQEIHKKDKKLKIIRFRKNFGQTAALDAGFKHSSGSIIIAMDADLQNDPKDIPKLLSKMNESYDVVSGWRKNRKDNFLKNLASKGANILRKILFRDKIHDSGCTFKAYRKECFENINLYGEMHRFIPALLSWKGFRITEVEVAHHERKHGRTKYTIKRLMKGFLDMLVVTFWMQYSARPMHLFGSGGILMGFLGFVIAAYITASKFMYGKGADRPLLLLAVLLIILGVQLMIFGVIADILVKVYYKDMEIYNIEKILK